MTSRLPLRLAAAAAVLVTFLRPVIAAGDPPAAAQEKGDSWEITSQMSMEGMPMAMPAQKAKVCSAKVWKQPPGGADDRMKCQNSDFQISGPKATWKTVCAGPPAMTGDGEITRDGADSYAGAIRFTSSEGNITIKLSGHRIGECDNPQ